MEEVPGVNCKESSLDALHQSVSETLSEALDFNRRDALAAAGDDCREEKIVMT